MNSLPDHPVQKTWLVMFACIAGVLLLGPVAPTATADPEDGAHTHAAEVVTHDGWSDEIIDVASRIPVQRGGRIKPLLTYARFTLLRMTGYTVFRKDKGKDSERIIGPMEWLLDVLFLPEVSTNYACIRVVDSDALVDVGLEKITQGKKKSDRYTFAELFPAAQTILKKARAYNDVEAKDRSPVQAQVILLAHNLQEMYGLITFVSFARTRLDVSTPKSLSKLFDGEHEVGPSAVLAKSAALQARFAVLTKGAAGGSQLTGEALAISKLRGRMREDLGFASSLRLLPPTGALAKRETWLTPADVAELDAPEPELVELIAGLAAMHAARGNTGAFLTALEAFESRSEKLAEARGEYGSIPLEVSLYSFDPFFKALLCFLIGFFVVAGTWIWSQNKWLPRVAMTILIAGFLLTAYGVTLRCVIRSRPPVTNLYETVLFITGIAVLACLVTEWINKQRIALAVAPVVGALGLFVAGRYEALEGGDTMGSLVAVLRTNFWLATHVTTIAIGYCAGILAGLMGCLYVLGRAFKFKQHDSRFYLSLSRMIYGMVAFCLLFAVVGTILGGIWANDSWGRFWGWDPKENGALMIVLSCLAIVHARLGGYIRSFGIAMSSIALGCVVAFSWWGVNLLGVGLHSYGFTQGIFNGLLLFWTTQVAVMLTGFSWWLLSRRKRARATG